MASSKEKRVLTSCIEIVALVLLGFIVSLVFLEPIKAPTSGIVQTGSGVSYVDDEGSIAFSGTNYFNTIYASPNLLQFDLTGTLSLNPSSQVTFTVTR
ncbi:MAG: hypothetical protein WB643_06710 [Candidatus Bathyarchaeia archaeon]